MCSDGVCLRVFAWTRVCVGQYIYETEPVRVQRGCQVMDTPTAAVLICLSSCECIQTCTALLVYTRLGL